MNESEAHIYEFGDFRIDAGKRLLSRLDGEQITLMPKVFDTLLYLVRRAGEIVEKDELMREIWTDTIVEENNLSQKISILRRILGEKRGEHRFIATIPGKGFKFVGDVRRVDGAAIPTPPNESFAESSVPLTELADSELQDESSESKNENQNLTDGAPANKKRKNLFWLAAVVGVFLIGLSLLWFNVWRENQKNAAVSAVKTVAVLRFKPLVLENLDEVLELGMADALISRLGGNREIVVRPLSSVRKYGNLEQDAVQAGRALDVETVLDGSIQRWGDGIRVNVRLIKVADGGLLWTGTFDEKFTGIFVVQDAISERVAAALQFSLGGGKKIRVGESYTKNAEAYEFYLRGRYFALKITEPDIRKAIGFYEQAIKTDSNYALAYAGMADAYRTAAIANYERSKDACPQAKALAKRALEIDESITDAHIVLGWIEFLYEWDWENAERELQRAIELEPNNSEAHRAYAHLLSNLGRHDEAVAMGRRARELAPLTLITAALEGQFLFYAGRDDEAIARLQKLLEIEPDFWVAHNQLGRVYILQERYREAIAALDKAVKLSGGSTEPVTHLGYGLAKSGSRKQAQAILAELKSAAVKQYVPAYNFAVIYNSLDEREEALKYLEKSLEEREVQITFIKIDTRWNNLRSEPRFIELMRRMNFE